MKLFTYKDFLEFYTKSVEQCIMNSNFVRVIWSEAYGFQIVASRNLPAGTKIQDANDLIKIKVSTSDEELVSLIKRYNWYQEKIDYTNQVVTMQLLSGLGTLANHNNKPNCIKLEDNSFKLTHSVKEGEEITINYTPWIESKYIAKNPSSLDRKFNKYQRELISEFHIDMKLFSVTFDLIEKRYADPRVDALTKEFERTKQSYERQKSNLEAQMRKQEASVAQTKSKLATEKEKFEDQKADFEEQKSELESQAKKED